MAKLDDAAISRMIDDLGEDEIARIIEGMPDDVIENMAARLDDVDRGKAKNPLAFYVPTERQEEFHSKLDIYDEVVFFAGNSGGKTYALCKEICCYLLGYDPSGGTPARKYPKPVRMGAGVLEYTKVWFCSTRLDKGYEMVQQYILPMLPDDYKSGMKEDKQKGTFRFAAGPMLQVMSYEAPAKQYQSDSVDFAGFDEQPPYAIYEETRARVARRFGKIAIAMSPLNSDSNWTYWEFVRNEHENPKLAYVEGSMEDNDYLSRAQKEMFIRAFAKSEDAQSRLFGKHSFLKGIVHTEFSETEHIVEPYEITDEHRNDWRFMRIIDLHPAQPEVCQWVMYQKEGPDAPRMVLFHDLRMRGSMIIPEFGKEIKRIDEMHGINPSVCIIDTPEARDSISQHVTMTIQLAQAGIHGMPAIRDLFAGIQRFNEYLIKPGAFQIFSTCKQTIRSIQDLRWQERRGPTAADKNAPGKVVEKDTHEVRNCHYAALFMPPLNRDRVTLEMKRQGLGRSSAVYNRNYQKKLLGGSYG